MVFEELNIVLFFDNHFFDINYAKFMKLMQFFKTEVIDS